VSNERGGDLPENSREADASMPRCPTRRRAIVFRLAAVLLGLFPFAALESALRFFDVCRPDLRADPFVGFSAVYPLFVLDETAGRYKIPRSRQAFFFPESFAADKSEREFRIFCLGGSTVAGHPYASATSFAKFLELGLESCDSTRRWEVVNCGGISYASYRLAPILQEVLEYKPDLVVLLTGHNEFLEARTYAPLRPIAWLGRGPLAQLFRLRTAVLIGWAVQECRSKFRRSGRPDRPTLPAEVDALLDYQGGLDDYERDDAWRAAVVAHYRVSLERMVRLAADAGVPTVLVNPPCNLRDCPPFKSQHRAGMTDEEVRRWESLWNAARIWYGDNPRRAVEILAQALEIDDEYAGVHYDLAKCYESLGQLREAHAEYLKAKEFDVCPLRILEPMNQAVLDVGRATGAILVDGRAVFERLCRHGIPGDDWLVDHVHPSIEGHQVLANAIIEALARADMVRPKTGWQSKRDRRWREHVDSLGDSYFAHGAQRLATLRLWAQGRTGPPRKGAARNSAPN
jgi:lysophospholipase L1-like esterase